MNLSATKQQSADANRQNAMTGDQDISVFCVDESLAIEQSLRCSLQVSQGNFKQQGQIKQNMSKLLFQNKQYNRLDNSKNDFKGTLPPNNNANLSRFNGMFQNSIDYKNKFNIFDNKDQLYSIDHSINIQKTKDLQEDENLIKLVSEHLIQSIQYLQKRQNQLQTSYLETEGEDVPDENIAIHTIKSAIVGPNLLSQKNETTDMEKVKYLEQNFTQLVWLQQCRNEQQNDRNNQSSQNQDSIDNTDSDTDLETPQKVFQQIIYKRGSSSETPTLARNLGKKNQQNLEESKTTSQMINSFSEEFSSDSFEENENSQEMNLRKQQSEGSNQKQRNFRQQQEDQLQKDIQTMKMHMHANGLINSVDLQKDQIKNQRQNEVQQFNRSPKKFLTTSNVQINTNQSNQDILGSQNIRLPKKQLTSIKQLQNNKTGYVGGLGDNNQQIKSNQEFSPPFDLLQPGERNSFLLPPQMIDNNILSGSTMDETYDLQQNIQQMKQLNQFEDKQINQKFNNLMQNSIMITQKKKSILSTQSHNHNHLGSGSGKKNDQQSYGVRFDQNVEFFDSNLDLLKKHHDQSMNQSLIPPDSRGGSQISHPSSMRSQSSNNRNLNTHNLQQTPSILEQRSSEIKNQHIIQEGWLLKKSTNKMLNTYQKRYFILTSEKLFYSKDPTFKKIKGCINLKYLTCFVSINKTNSKKLHLKITEMKKLLKLKEIIPGDITKWWKNLQQVISYYYNQEKVMMGSDQQIKNNYKRDVITESDLESMAETGDIIIFHDSDKSKNLAVQNQIEMGMLIKFNNNDLRVFYVDRNNSINLCHWENFILENDIYNSLIFRKLQMTERNQILPFIYESVRQHLNDNYKKKLKDTLSDSQEDSKQLPSIQKNSQLIASIYQKANLIKSEKNTNKYTTDSFCQKKRLKLLNDAKLSNEITVVLKRHIFFASENSDME